MVTLVLRFTARVRNGRLVLDQSTDLPEGSTVDLVPADAIDSLDDDQRQALHAALARSAADESAGRTIDAATVLDRLRAPR